MPKAPNKPLLIARFALATIFCFAAIFQVKAQEVEVSPEGFETFKMQTSDTSWIMKKYYFCMLVRGNQADSLSREELMVIQRGHMAHLEQLGKDGKICIAGPFDGGEDWRGLVVYNVPSIEEATRLAQADPAVQAGRLEARIVPWWAGVGSRLE